MASKSNTATQRMRNLRERRKQGIAMTVPVEIFDAEIDLLIRLRILTEDQRNDRMVVIEAVETILEDWSKEYQIDGL